MILVVLCALFAITSRVHAQEERLETRLDAETHTAVMAVIDSARQAGLPTEPLVLKALEGASKQASGPRIIAAVQSLARELRESRTLLGASATPTELTAAAGALHAGATHAELL